MDDKIPMTVAEYEKLNSELKKLKSVDRPTVAAAIEQGRACGYASPELLDARDRQTFLEGRIGELEQLLPRVQLIDPQNQSGNKVVFGATVVLSDVGTGQTKTCQIVGQLEADLDKGKISHISPLAKALMDKTRGDVAEVQTHDGVKKYKIMDIRFV